MTLRQIQIYTNEYINEEIKFDIQNFNKLSLHLFSSCSCYFPPLDAAPGCCLMTSRFVQIKSPMSETISRRVRWRAPVIQVTGRLRLAKRLSSGDLSCSGLCRSGVRTKFGIDMVLQGELRTTRSSKEGCIGPGRRRSRPKPPCRSVVGSRL